MKIRKEIEVWKNKILKNYDIEDDQGITFVQIASEAYERMKRAQEVLEKDGLTVVTPGGLLKGHPCTIIEKDSRNALILALGKLNLKIEDVI